MRETQAAVFTRCVPQIENTPIFGCRSGCRLIKPTLSSSITALSPRLQFPIQFWEGFPRKGRLLPSPACTFTQCKHTAPSQLTQFCPSTVFTLRHQLGSLLCYPNPNSAKQWTSTHAMNLEPPQGGFNWLSDARVLMSHSNQTGERRIVSGKSFLVSQKLPTYFGVDETSPHDLVFLVNP